MINSIETFNLFAIVWNARLIHAAIHGGLALLIILLVSRVIPNIPGQLRSWLWRLAFVKLLIAMVWVQPIELHWLPPVHSMSIVKANNVAAGFTDGIKARSDRDPADKTALPAAFISTDVIQHSISTAALSGASWLMIAWCVGVLIPLMRLFVQWAHARKVICGTALVTDQMVLTELNECCRRLRIVSVPELRVTHSTASPFLVGIFRPVIVLPSILLQANFREMLTTAMTHELAHLKRHDLAWNLLPAFAEACFFFHPLVWLARREWILVQEIAADELAVAVSKMSVAQYAKSLLEIVTTCRSRSHSSHLVVTVSAAYSQLSRRMNAIQTFHKFRSSHRFVTGFIVLAITVLGIIPWTLAPRTLNAHTDATQPSPKMKSEEQKPVESPKSVTTQAQTVAPQDEYDIKQFDRDYALAASEVVKRIAPPFPASRMAYYRIEMAEQAKHMPKGPATFCFQWENGQNSPFASFGNDSQVGSDLKSLLPVLCRIGPEFLKEGERLLERRPLADSQPRFAERTSSPNERMLDRKLSGDFSVRVNASREEIVAALQKIITDEWKTQVSLKLAMSEQEVYVASGTFQLSESTKERGFVLLEDTLVGGSSSVKEATEYIRNLPQGDAASILEYLGRVIGVPVINEIEKGPEGRVRFTSILADFNNHQGTVFTVNHERIVKSFAEQTGLTMKKEKCKILILEVLER